MGVPGMPGTSEHLGPCEGDIEACEAGAQSLPGPPGSLYDSLDLTPAALPLQ